MRWHISEGRVAACAWTTATITPLSSLQPSAVSSLSRKLAASQKPGIVTVGRIPYDNDVTRVQIARKALVEMSAGPAAETRRITHSYVTLNTTTAEPQRIREFAMRRWNMGSLLMKKLKRVVVLVNASKRYDRRVVQGVASYVRERANNWDLYVDEHPLQRLPNLRDWDGDGIIAGLDDHRVAAVVAGLKIPVVGIGGGKGWYDPASRIPYFATDNERIGQMAAEHLLACGFRRLAFYGDRKSRFHDWSQQRGKAFVGQARSAGVPCFTHLGGRPTAHNWARLQADVANWIDSLEKPIGLMACTDIRARQAIEACRMIGARVPDDVAVIGVDNDELVCELVSPPLSSIEQGSRLIGYQAAAMLNNLMSGKRPSRLRRVVPPERLIARQSTDVLACDDDDLTSALAFVRQHACDSIHVSDVLEVVRISRSTLEQKFATLLGRSIHAEIQRLQIERAKDLLLQTNLLVKQVARRSGFKHVQYMTEVFRRCVGQSPAKYRQRRRR